jgi:hypothetical protein
MTPASVETPSIPNGAAAAALLSAGLGSFAFAILAFAGDKSAAIKNTLVFYKPTGALSGVSTVALAVWLVAWIILATRWNRKTVAVAGIAIASLVLLALSLVLTFPPIVDLL